ncbi:MAG: peptidylprolyl isomerase [Myxococcota bacterium]
MTHFKHTLLTALLVALTVASGLTLAVAEADARIIDRIVARVNDEIITLYELEKAATPFLLQNGMDPSALEDPDQRPKVLDEVLTELVNRELLLQEADKLDLEVTDKEVDQWLAYTQKQQGVSEEQFRQLISQYGMDYSEYREMIRQNLLKMRIVKVKVGSQVSVSEKKVDREFDKQFGEQAGREKYIGVRHILIRPESNSQEAIAAAKSTARTLRERVQSGEKFEDVAREASMGPSAKKGGFLGTFRKGELSDETFESAAFELEEGEISEVVESKFGFHVITVDNVDYKTDVDAEEKKAQLRAKLQQEAVEEQLGAYLKNLRARSFVRVDYDPKADE